MAMIPAVMITALLAGRWSVTFAICLSIVFNILQVRHIGQHDAALNSVLFALISWGFAEVCWRLTHALRRAANSPMI